MKAHKPSVLVGLAQSPLWLLIAMIGLGLVLGFADRAQVAMQGVISEWSENGKIVIVGTIDPDEKGERRAVRNATGAKVGRNDFPAYVYSDNAGRPRWLFVHLATEDEWKRWQRVGAHVTPVSSDYFLNLSYHSDFGPIFDPKLGLVNRNLKGIVTHDKGPWREYRPRWVAFEIPTTRQK